MRIFIEDAAIVIVKDRICCTAGDKLLIKSLITQWAKEISALNNDGDPAGIPVEIDYMELGQIVLYLIAIRKGSNIILRFISFLDDHFEWSNARAFAPGDYIPYSVVETFRDITLKERYVYPEPFGEYSFQIFVDALLEAEIV
jgi:hypothetical protein